MLKRLLILSFCLIVSGCCRKEIPVVVTSRVVNADYIGNGAEWDPYDEALSWGSDLSEEDWQTLFARVDILDMGYVRCMINSPFLYWDAERGEYDRTRNSKKLIRILQYCKDNDIAVVYGEFNPPAPEMKDSQKWVEMSVNYLNWLVVEQGLDCIRYFVIFNEPDGDWATTDGDYELWRSMALRFDAEMDRYPGLKEKVTLAAPDAVVHWVHPVTGLAAADWVSRTVEDLDSIVGIYDVHAYPGQAEVRDGRYAEKLKALRSLVPEGKRIILGEAGFKYENPEDSLLMNETMRRAEAHEFAGGIDSNMMVYDHFYGLDMSLLAMDVMNNGYSGMAVWMLDDAGHSVGDTGRSDNIKVWGFWNILGKEVFGDSSEEDVRPWFWAWSLMCRYFPAGCDILMVEAPEVDSLRMCASCKDGAHTLAAVNWSETDCRMTVSFPSSLQDARLYVYEEGKCSYDEDGLPSAREEGLCGHTRTIVIPSQSLVVLTDME